MRPNIRVEIQNNAPNKMEVDENEDGELTDQDEEPHFHSPLAKVEVQNEEEKLQERAKRFSLAPNEIRNFTETDLNVTYSSLGIASSSEQNVRYNTAHMRGIDGMTAADIVEYLMEFVPQSVEWVDEECCNVVFQDQIAAARALHFMSKAVRGMPVRDDSCYFFSEHEPDQSILLIGKNRQIQVLHEEDHPQNQFLNEANSVDISEITVAIPPGYWRLGKHKNKCLLLRFALRTDKKPTRTEQLGRYYKATTKKNIGIFSRNKDLHKNAENPWTDLAKNWDEDSAFREKSPIPSPEVEVKNENLRVRLGAKRSQEDSPPPAEEPKNPKLPRMRMYADEEEEKIKRKKMLNKLSHQIDKLDEDTSANNDLRTILNLASRTTASLNKDKPEEFDLGRTLKNRNKKMVFEIKSEEARSPGRSRNFDDEEGGFRSDSIAKTRSKVAVVRKKFPKPAVASTVNSIWSRVGAPNDSGSDDSSSQPEDEDASANRRGSRSRRPLDPQQNLDMGYLLYGRPPKPS